MQFMEKTYLKKLTSHDKISEFKTGHVFSKNI